MTERGRAWLSISPEFLAERLGFPKGVEIIRADMNAYNFGVRLGAQGPGLPILDQGEAAAEIQLQYFVEEIEGIRNLYGSWSHTPDDRWLIESRPIAAPRARDKKSEAA